MKTKVKTLYKNLKERNITGKQMGELILLDAVDSYNCNMLKMTKKIPVFERADIDECIETLSQNEQQTYYTYEEIARQLTELYTMFIPLYAQLTDNYYFRLYSLLKTAQMAEDEYKADSYTPVILTEEKFDAWKENNEKELRQERQTVYEIFLNYLSDILEKYRKGTGNLPAINSYLDDLKTYPIENKRIIKYLNNITWYETDEGEKEKDVNPTVWQELLTAGLLKKKKEHPNDLSKFDILDKYYFWYGVTPLRYGYKEAPELNPFKEFIKDYRPLYQYIWETMENVPILNFIKTVDVADIVNNPLITKGELADANILDYKKSVKNLCDKQPYIAILKAGVYNSFIKNRSKLPHRKFLSESLLIGETGQIISDYQKNINDGLLNLYTYKEYIDLTADVLNLKELKAFYSDVLKKINDRMDILNELFKEFLTVTRSKRTPDELPTNVLRKRLSKKLKPIKTRKYLLKKQFHNTLLIDTSPIKLAIEVKEIQNEITQTIKKNLI